MSSPTSPSASSREVILARIRAAQAAAAPLAESAGHHPRYRRSAGLTRSELLDRFAARVADYKATVTRTSHDGLGAAVTAALAARRARRVIVAPGLDLPPLPGIRLVTDDGLGAAELDAVDGVITGCAVAIAETGTIVLDGGEGQGRRALSLVPDYHLCLVAADQVVGLVPEAVERLAAGPLRPLTWISGPSATSDIELERVEGVHGPRTLDVILTDPG